MFPGNAARRALRVLQIVKPELMVVALCDGHNQHAPPICKYAVIHPLSERRHDLSAFDIPNAQGNRSSVEADQVSRISIEEQKIHARHVTLELNPPTQSSKAYKVN